MAWAPDSAGGQINPRAVAQPTVEPITEGRREEAGNELERAVLSDALRIVPVAVLVVDAFDRIRLANDAAAQLLDRSVEELQAGFLQSQLSMHDRADGLASSAVRRAAWGPNPTLVALADGRLVQAKFTPVRDRWGKIAHACVTLEPLDTDEPRTDLLALESVGRLAGELAHDINNQLSAALNYVFILRRRIAEQPLTNHLEELQAAIWRASGLTSTLKAVARKRRQPEHLQLGSVLRELEPLLCYVAGDIRLQLRVPRELPVVDAPLAYFEQVVVTIVLFLIARAPSDSVLKVSAQAMPAAGGAASPRARIVFELLSDGQRTNTRPTANGHRTHSGLRRALKRCNARIGHDASRVWVQF